MSRHVYFIEGEDGDGDTEKKRQKRGGKGQIKTKKKAEPQGIRLGTAKRGKKKRVTIVIGIGTYGELKSFNI